MVSKRSRQPLPRLALTKGFSVDFVEDPVWHELKLVRASPKLLRALEPADSSRRSSSTARSKG
jgi:hypothetical protein